LAGHADQVAHPQAWGVPRRLGHIEAIRTGGAFDFLAHPSCLVVEDPTFEAVKLICDLVKEAGAEKAAVVDLGTIAAR